MRFQDDRRPWNVRALLELTATPFTIADYRPRAAIFRQGDPCDSVMHIESGRVWLAVTARSGKEAICGRDMRLTMATTIVTTLALTPLLAADNEPAKRLDDAAAVFSEIMGSG